MLSKSREMPNAQLTNKEAHQLRAIAGHYIGLRQKLVQISAIKHVKLTHQFRCYNKK